MQLELPHTHNSQVSSDKTYVRRGLALQAAVTAHRTNHRTPLSLAHDLHTTMSSSGSQHCTQATAPQGHLCKSEHTPLGTALRTVHIR